MRRRRHQILLSLSPLHERKRRGTKKNFTFYIWRRGRRSQVHWLPEEVPHSLFQSLTPFLFFSPLLSRDFAGKERREEELSASPLDSKRESLWTQEHKRRGRLFIGPYLLPPFLLLSICVRAVSFASICWEISVPPSFYAGHDFLYSPPSNSRVFFSLRQIIFVGGKFLHLCISHPKNLVSSTQPVNWRHVSALSFSSSSSAASHFIQSQQKSVTRRYIPTFSSP